MGGAASRAAARKGRNVAAAAAAPATTSSMSDQAEAEGARKRAFLVFNPVAGQEDPQECLKAIREAVEASLELRVLDTQPDVSAATLAKQALQEGAEVVLASGGDGTINEVAGVLMGTGVPLGIIPRGTANAFASRFRIPTHLNGPNFISDAAKIVVDGHVQPVDAALVTTSTKTDMPMILLAGVGMEAEVVEAADREMKDALGPAAYLVAGAQEVVNTDGFHAKVKFDDNEAEAQLDFLTVANAAPSFSVLAHGGEVQENQPDDGRLEVVAHVHADSTLANLTDMARIFIRSLTGIEAPQDRVASGRVKQIEVVADPPAKVVVDGELAGCTPLTATVQPGALRVIVPRPGQDAPTVVDKLRDTVAGIKDKILSTEEEGAPAQQGPGV